MSFTSSLLSILMSFFHSFISILGGDINYELGWLGLNISLLMYSWGHSLSRYGILIPAMLVALVGVTIAGLLVVLVFLDSAKDLVGG